MNKNEMFARGHIIDMHLTNVISNMRKMVRDTSTDKYERIDETVTVESVRGIISLRINDNIMKFRVDVPKQRQYFTAGERIKEYAGYDYWLQIYDAFVENPDADLYVELKGFVSDGTFYKDGRMVYTLSWNAGTIMWAENNLPECCNARFCGAFYKHNGKTKIFMMPAVGGMPFEMYASIDQAPVIPDAVKDNVRATGYSEACDFIIARTAERETDELGGVKQRNSVRIKSIKPTEQGSAKYGFITKEAIKRSIDTQPAFEAKVRARAMR